MNSAEKVIELFEKGRFQPVPWTQYVQTPKGVVLYVKVLDHHPRYFRR